MRFLLAILLLLFVAPASAQQSQGMSKALVVSSCGGGALASGPLNQLTMDTTGRLCQSGIGSNVCSQAAAYLARTVGGNEGGNAVNITALICGLVTDGVIDGDLLTGKCGSHLDALYILAQKNAADAVLNLCGTNYTLTGPSGFPAFTTYVGYGPFNGSNLTLITGIVLAATGFHYTQNAASFGFWAHTVPDAVAIMGCGNDTDPAASNIFANYSGGAFYARVNNGTAASVTSPAAVGFYVADRSSSSAVVPYYNGAALSTVSSTSLAVDAGCTFIVGSSFINGTSTILSEAHIGGSLGAALNLALYNRLRTYMTAMPGP